MPGDVVELAVIGFGVDAPEARSANVSETRAESVAKQSKQPEYNIAIGARVRHDLRGLQSGLLFEYDRQQDQAVAQCAWSRDRVETGKLVGEQVVPGHTLELPEVLGIGSAMNGADRHHEAHAIGGSDISATPLMCQRNFVLRRNEPGIGGGQCVVADI